MVQPWWCCQPPCETLYSNIYSMLDTCCYSMQFAINFEYSGCVRGKRRKLTINTSAGTFPSQGQCSDLTMETFSPCWQCSVPSPQCSKCPLGCCNQHVSQHRCRPHPHHPPKPAPPGPHMAATPSLWTRWTEWAGLHWLPEI